MLWLQQKGHRAEHLHKGLIGDDVIRKGRELLAQLAYLSQHCPAVFTYRQELPW